MEIEFEDRRLKSLYEHPEKLEKAFGAKNGSKNSRLMK